MAKKSDFQGQYYYYENINGKEKKVEKKFTDKKRYDAFVKKNPMPKFKMPSFDFWDFKLGLDDFIHDELGSYFDEPKKMTSKKKTPKKKAPRKKKTPIKKKVVSKKKK